MNYRRQLSVVRSSPLLDDGWYKHEYPDVARASMDSGEHYLRHGSAEGRDPGPQFDTSYYLQNNPDVAASGMNPLVHYTLFGLHEGRQTLGFRLDPDFYCALYPDVSESGLNPWDHYRKIGEKRRYYTSFDEVWYLEEYPELAAFNGSLKQHYLSHGQFEGRIPAFDSAWYLDEYPQVRSACSDPTEHYRTVGKTLGFHAGFDRNFYLLLYRDISESGLDAYEHYTAHGRHEGRVPAFNRHWYTGFYKDVADRQLDPHAHYTSRGRWEGRPLSFSDRMNITKWGFPNTHFGTGATTSVEWKVPEPRPDFSPMVSVIVPNFNHAPFLRERLESIYSQTYENFEVILLDDASTDDSVAVLAEYAEKYSDKTRLVCNIANSGGVFNQWKRGLELATGEIIWIAESDDYCDKNLLCELVRFFRNNAVMAAFCRTDFVAGNSGNRTWTSEEYWAEIDFNSGAAPFVMPSHKLVETAWGARNIAPNVSAVLFRNPGNLSILDDPEWRGLRMCGDWIFYLSLIRGGLVGYSPNVTNYYRQHPQNTSISTHDKDIYYEEHEVVARYLNRTYAVGEKVLRAHEEVLYRHWCMKRGHNSRAEFERLFSLKKVIQEGKLRQRNIAVATYALVTGGGEAFPILLANLLHERGFAVTLLNFQSEVTNLGVRRTLNPSIPIVEPKNSAECGDILKSLGVELVHSHHGWVDITLAIALENFPSIRQVVTTHGFYEIMAPETVRRYENDLKRIDAFVYIADKNLPPFSEEFRKENVFRKITNTISMRPLSNLSREELGFNEGDFLLCLASRAVAEKGWSEAIEATRIANERSSRRIGLILIGDGPEFERLIQEALPTNVRLLGFRDNVRDYFALCDAGLIASRFRGESCPLVLIECLSVGRPVISTEIGEVREMLSTEDGLAGVIEELDNWSVNVISLSDKIHSLANDAQLYEEVTGNVSAAARKFDQDLVVDQYIGVYNSVFQSAKRRSRQTRLSVVLVAYNMARELPRTLLTLSPTNQELSSDDYEVIVVDNGSTQEYDVQSLQDICPNMRLVRMEHPSPSPVAALNQGIEMAEGVVVCAFIDAARMGSPNLLKAGLAACEMHDRAVVGSLSFHLGHEAQNASVFKGYNQTIEDELLATVNWRLNSYELFRISSFDPSSRFGLYECPAETNALFLRKELWNEYGGFDPAFKGRGGGLVNLDMWRRLCEDERNLVVTLLGEGTFHQFHGGVATNAVSDVWEEMHAEYVAIRGVQFRVPSRKPFLFGRAHRWLLEFEERAGRS
ncbi:glycosyltransferase [Ensifer sp. ENS02]|uniref:glycosyltransferase n=1 Tax=Ensifer sp. ENS02 TaxID=2769290 RepID=UPI0013AE8962|nr:glycosyltransferase [Ensifer sp. ENS02]MBD9520725.1 glycosyltransferase [Ensifer sp. ENS02]